MVLDMSQQRSATEASLAAAHQGITEAAARERDLVEQLQKADAVTLPRSGQLLMKPLQRCPATAETHKDQEILS